MESAPRAKQSLMEYQHDYYGRLEKLHQLVGKRNSTPSTVNMEQKMSTKIKQGLLVKSITNFSLRPPQEANRKGQSLF